MRIVGSNPTPGTISYLESGHVPGRGLIARGGRRLRSRSLHTPWAPSASLPPAPVGAAYYVAAMSVPARAHFVRADVGCGITRQTIEDIRWRAAGLAAACLSFRLPTVDNSPQQRRLCAWIWRLSMAGMFTQDAAPA